MYNIESKPFGYKLTFSGKIERDEMAAWVDASKKALTSAPSNFGIVVDMRGFQPIDADTKGVMEEGQKLYKTKGMTRSAVGVDSATMALQFKRIAKQTGIYEWERYIDVSAESNWEKVAVNWIENEVDPED